MLKEAGKEQEQSYRHLNPGSTGAIQHEIPQLNRSKSVSVSDASFMGISDLPVASLVVASEKEIFSGYEDWF